MFSKFKIVLMLYLVLFSNKRVAHIFTPVIYYALLILNIIKVIKIMWLAKWLTQKIYVSHLWLLQKNYITYRYPVNVYLKLKMRKCHQWEC